MGDEAVAMVADDVPKSNWVVGAFLNIFGSVLINFGTNVMKLGHLRSLKRKRRVALQDALLPRIPEDDRTDEDLVVYRCCQESWTWIPSRGKCRFRRALLSKTWVMGFCLFFVGNVLNFFVIRLRRPITTRLFGLRSVRYKRNLCSGGITRISVHADIVWDLCVNLRCVSSR